MITNLNYLIFPSRGSKTPAFKLFLHLPFFRSKPVHFKSFFLGSSEVWLALWKTFSLAMRSVASWAALVARVFGMIVSASQNLR